MLVVQTLPGRMRPRPANASSPTPRAGRRPAMRPKCVSPRKATMRTRGAGRVARAAVWRRMDTFEDASMMRPTRPRCVLNASGRAKSHATAHATRTANEATPSRLGSATPTPRPLAGWQPLLVRRRLHQRASAAMRMLTLPACRHAPAARRVRCRMPVQKRGATRPARRRPLGAHHRDALRRSPPAAHGGCARARVFAAATESPSARRDRGDAVPPDHNATTTAGPGTSHGGGDAAKTSKHNGAFGRNRECVRRHMKPARAQ